MPDINIIAVFVAAVASFVASGAWYAVFGNTMARLQAEWRDAKAPDQPEIWKMVGFFASSLVTVFVMAFLLGLTDISGWPSAVGLGLLLWVGFAATQWLGSILGEDVPLKLAAIHAGDWLVKLLIIAVIVGVWQSP